MATHPRRPYTGTENSLVIAIDVGTTFSGVSYALLEPGMVPRIKPVSRFPGQYASDPNVKVPSVVCYDQNGNVIAAGAETDHEVNPILSEMEDVRRAEWFKLLLRPPHLAANQRTQLENLLQYKDIPRPATGVFADFLQYLFKCAKEYIVEQEQSLRTWSSIDRNIYFVLTHPNGWEGKQQSQMRDAAIAAGLVDRSTAADRIMFLSEGEASLHFCLDKNPELHQEYGGLLVVDCGGGTIDLNAYSRTEKGGFNEIVSPDCLLQGSIFVTYQKLRDSQFGSDDDFEAMARAFDKPGGAKCMFRDPEKPCYVRFGGLRDNDRKYDISRGQFKMEGAQVATFFEPAVQDIIGGIVSQCNNAKVSIKYVLVVGGFGRSDYLYARLRDYFKSRGIVILRPDSTHLNKAVADGAVSWYLDRCVSARIAKYSYGVMVEAEFDPDNAEHMRRASKKVMDADGNFCIPGYFSTILKRGTKVSEETEFRQSHGNLLTPAEFLRCTSFTTDLTCYLGQADTPPEWIDLEPDSFRRLCTIQVDMSNIKRNLMPQVSGFEVFYELSFDVVILLGLTELRAYIAWQEDGVEKRYGFSFDSVIRDH